MSSTNEKTILAKYENHVDEFDSIFKKKITEKPDQRYINTVMAQFEKATKEPSDYCKFAMDEEGDIHVIYILIHNIPGKDGEFQGGEYIFKMLLPADFPYNPPDFVALTPNGIYGHGKKCCISIGSYHKDQYKPSLGISGFAMELANGLMNYDQMGNGINLLLKTPTKHLQTLAEISKDYNKQKWKDINDMINGQFEKYSAKWAELAKEENSKEEKPLETTKGPETSLKIVIDEEDVW